MDVQAIMTQAGDTLSVKRVFGQPVEEDGVTVIPAATIRGGAGGGHGEGPDGKQQGEGTGFGLVAKPAGAYIVKDGKATWRPAIDVNRIVLGGQAVAIAALLTLRTLIKSRTAAQAPRRPARRSGRPRLAARG